MYGYLSSLMVTSLCWIFRSAAWSLMSFEVVEDVEVVKVGMLDAVSMVIKVI